MTSNNKIKFSILIPTKDRLNLLKEAVNSILSQSYSNWELIIVDNCSRDNVEDYIISLKDERIVYYIQPNPVSVTENWNTANDLATGDYMIMLGDDDALVPDALETLEKKIIIDAPQIISFMAYLYLQPNVDTYNPLGDVNLENPFSVISPFSVINFTEEQSLSLEWRKNVIDKCFSFERAIGYNMQYYCYSKEMVQILEQYGKFYEPPYPDYYTTSMCMLLAEKFVYIPKALAIIGITPKSYGYYYINNIEKEGMKFHKEADYRLYAPLTVQNKLCSVDEMDTAAFVTFTCVSEKTKMVRTSLNGYYKAVIRKEIQYHNIKEIYDLISVEMKQNVSNKEYEELLEYARECEGEIPVHNGCSDNIVCFSTVSELLDNLQVVERVVKERYDGHYPDICQWLNKFSFDELHSYIRDRRLWIWGAYRRSFFLAQKMQWEGFHVEGYIDKAYGEKEYMEKRVVRIEDIIDSNKQIFIMIPLMRMHNDIIEVLNQYGYELKRDFIYLGYENEKGHDE